MRQGKGLRVLSLFDGMSCGQIALRELGIPVAAYYASEVDKFAIQQTQLNFPETVQIGDVRNVDVDRLCDEAGEFDLLLAGFPCTDLSLAGKRRGMSTTTKEKVTSLSQYLDLKDAGFEFAGQSYLFWEFVRIFQRLRERNPKLLFLLENVEVGKEWDAVISDTLGIQGVHINSALVSAQNRKRIYWSNIRVREEGLFGYRYTDIPQPTDRGIMLKDILETEVEEKYYLKDEVVQKLLEHKERHKEAGHGFGAVFHDTDGKIGAVKVGGKGFDDLVKIEANSHLLKNITYTDSKANAFLATSHKGAWANGMTIIRVDGNKSSSQPNRVYSDRGKSPNIGNAHFSNTINVANGYRIRRITPTECARLQTIPEWYRWEYVKKFIDIDLCELNVKLKDAIDSSHVEKPDCVICTILDSLELVQQMQDQKLIKQKNAQWKVAIESKLHTWDYASCTIKDSQSMDHAISCRFNQNMQRRVLYVENLSMEEMGLQKDCVQNIIAVLKFTGIQVRLIKGTKNGEIILGFMDICQDATEWQSTEEFLKITLAGNSIEENVFTISILIKQIIELRTYIFSILKANTKKLILNFLLSQLSVSSVALLSLRMGIIESTSATQQYRLLGNGWNIETIKHIFSFMKLEDTV